MACCTKGFQKAVNFRIIWDDAFQEFAESSHSLIHHPYMRLNLLAAMSSNLKVHWRPSCNHYPIISLFFILALVSIMIQYPISSIDSLTDVSFQDAFGLKTPPTCRATKSCQTHGIVGDYKYLPPRSLKLDKRLRSWQSCHGNVAISTSYRLGIIYQLAGSWVSWVPRSWQTFAKKGGWDVIFRVFRFTGLPCPPFIAL